MSEFTCKVRLDGNWLICKPPVTRKRIYMQYINKIKITCVVRTKLCSFATNCADGGSFPRPAGPSLLLSTYKQERFEPRGGSREPYKFCCASVLKQFWTYGRPTQRATCVMHDNTCKYCITQIYSNIEFCLSDGEFNSW